MKKATTTEAAWDMQHKFEGPHGWIPWKGTDVCMDVHCVCGALCHIDAAFAYHVECGACGRIYFCNGNIELIELEQDPGSCVVLATAGSDPVDSAGLLTEKERSAPRSHVRCDACGGRGMIEEGVNPNPGSVH